jgi:SAM-dependent methyltransferase
MNLSGKYARGLFVVWVFFCLAAGRLTAQDKEGQPNQADREMNRIPAGALIAHFESPDRAAWQKPDTVIAMLGNLRDKTVVDIGAGSGYFTFRLTKVARKVIAADVNDRFIGYLKMRRDSLECLTGASNIEIRKIPYNSPDLKNREADAVLVVDTYHHIENRVDYLKKLKKGMKPGGILLIVDFNPGNGFGPPDHHKLKPDVVLEELKDAGYENIQSDTSTLPYQYMIKSVL